MYRGREIEKEEEKEQGFPLRVTYRNMRTGMVEKTDPYVLRIIGEDGGRQQLWERPAGSGNLFNAQGEPVGRWDAKKPEGQRFLKGEEHIKWTAPETADQKLAREYAIKDARIVELEKELLSIKTEREPKEEPPKGNKKTQGA